jgi:hypothetical protein
LLLAHGWVLPARPMPAQSRSSSSRHSPDRLRVSLPVKRATSPRARPLSGRTLFELPYTPITESEGCADVFKSRTSDVSGLPGESAPGYLSPSTDETKNAEQRGS